MTVPRRVALFDLDGTLTHRDTEDEWARLLGERGLMAVQRLMGMLLTTIAVQMFLTGVRDFLAAG